MTWSSTLAPATAFAQTQRPTTTVGSALHAPHSVQPVKIPSTLAAKLAKQACFSTLANVRPPASPKTLLLSTQFAKASFFISFFFLFKFSFQITSSFFLFFFFPACGSNCTTCNGPTNDNCTSCSGDLVPQGLFELVYNLFT